MWSKFAASIIFQFYFADFFFLSRCIAYICRMISCVNRQCTLQKRKKYAPSFRVLPIHVGLGTEFGSEKIPRNILGTVSVIPQKKVLIPRHSEFRGRASSEALNETEWTGIPRKNMTLTVDIDGLLFISSWKLLQKNKRPYCKRTWLKFIQHIRNKEFAEPVFL
jgi:hypothetical protein